MGQKVGKLVYTIYIIGECPPQVIWKLFVNCEGTYWVRVLRKSRLPTQIITVLNFEANMNTVRIAQPSKLFLFIFLSQVPAGAEANKASSRECSDDDKLLCAEHQGETGFFCRTCDVLVCQKCIVSNHHEKTRHHDIEDVNKVYKEKLKMVRSEIFKAEYDSDMYNEEWSKAEEKQWDLLAYSYFQQERIDKEFEDCEPHPYIDDLKSQIDEECEEDLYENTR